MLVQRRIEELQLKCGRFLTAVISAHDEEVANRSTPWFEKMNLPNLRFSAGSNHPIGRFFYQREEFRSKKKTNDHSLKKGLSWLRNDVQASKKLTGV